MENSERDGNTKPPDLPLEKSVAGQEATVRTGRGQTFLNYRLFASHPCFTTALRSGAWLKWPVSLTCHIRKEPGHSGEPGEQNGDDSGRRRPVQALRAIMQRNSVIRFAS